MGGERDGASRASGSGARKEAREGGMSRREGDRKGSEDGVGVALIWSRLRSALSCAARLCPCSWCSTPRFRRVLGLELLDAGRASLGPASAANRCDFSGFGFG
jgi:hypothetical protein